MNKEYFDSFIERLRNDNIGSGVDYHYTRNPIFIVQNLVKDYGYDVDYCDNYEWTNFENEGIVANETTSKRLDLLEDDGRQTKNWTKVYYHVRWNYVSAHFTKQGAEEFIKRKGHDYNELRIWVDSQVYCNEWNNIIQGLIEGKLIYKGD